MATLLCIVYVLCFLFHIIFVSFGESNPFLSINPTNPSSCFSFDFN